MKTIGEFSWRRLLEAGRWQKTQLGYARGRQRIERSPVRPGTWFYYPDVRQARAFVFRRLTSALRNARRP